MSSIKTTNWKRIVSLLLVAVMCLGLLPEFTLSAKAYTPASGSYAAGNNPNITQRNKDSASDGEFVTLRPEKGLSDQSWWFKDPDTGVTFTDVDTAIGKGWFYNDYIDKDPRDTCAVGTDRFQGMYAAIEHDPAIDSKLSGNIGQWITKAGYVLDSTTGQKHYFKVKLTYYWKTVNPSSGIYVPVMVGSDVGRVLLGGLRKGINQSFVYHSYEIQYDLFWDEDGMGTTNETKPVTSGVNLRLTLGDVDNGQMYGLKIQASGMTNIYCLSDAAGGSGVYYDYNASNGYHWAWADPNFASPDGSEAEITFEVQNLQGFRMVVIPEYFCANDYADIMPAGVFSAYGGSDDAVANATAMLNKKRQHENYCDTHAGYGEAYKWIGRGAWAYVTGGGFGPSKSEITKRVSNVGSALTTSNELEVDENTYEYFINAFIPEESPHYPYTKCEIQDSLPEGIKFVSAQVYEGGTEANRYADGTLSDKWVVSSSADKQSFTVAAKPETLTDFATLYYNYYHVKVTVEVDTEADTYEDEHVFTNNARLVTDYDTPKSNDVETVIHVADPNPREEIYNVTWDENYDGGGVTSTVHGRWYLDSKMETKTDLSVSTDGGSASTSNKATQKVNQIIKVKWGWPNDPVREGFEFKGWSMNRNATSSDRVYSNAFAGGLSQAAHDDALKTMLSYDPEKDKDGVGADDTAWLGILAQVKSMVLREPLETWSPATYYAVWQPLPIRWVANGGSGSLYSGGVYTQTFSNWSRQSDPAKEFKVPANAPVRAGYVFTGWYIDADCTQAIETYEGGVLPGRVYYAIYPFRFLAHKMLSFHPEGDII